MDTANKSKQSQLVATLGIVTLENPASSSLLVFLLLRILLSLLFGLL